jgi:hypothetical protein
MESWHTAWVPRYRLIAEPVRSAPEGPPPDIDGR